MPNADDFRAELRAQLRHTGEMGEPSIVIKAGELHRKIGRYSEPCNRMPNCCNVMCSEMSGDDEIISSPPSGQGAGLTIHYRLPRR